MHAASRLFTGFSPYLRVNLEVSLLNKLVVARVRAWGSGLASWDGVGEPGGAWEGGLRSRICPPWNVLLTVVPLERREDGVEDEEEAPEAPAMLCVEGEAGGRRWDKELQWQEKQKLNIVLFSTGNKQALATGNIFNSPPGLVFQQIFSQTCLELDWCWILKMLNAKLCIS